MSQIFRRVVDRDAAPVAMRRGNTSWIMSALTPGLERSEERGRGEIEPAGTDCGDRAGAAADAGISRTRPSPRQSSPSCGDDRRMRDHGQKCILPMKFPQRRQRN